MGIQSLPPELLLLIFSIGCNDKSTGNPIQTCIARKRKPFAHLTRQICIQWQTIIDDPANLHFWVAQLFIGLPDEDAITFRFEKESSFDRSIVKQLIDLKYCLTTSEGCELTISVSLPTTRWTHNVEELSSDAVLTLRLLLHGVQLILPYQNQVTSIQIEGYVPLVWGWLISLIMAKFRTAHILEGIHLRAVDYPLDLMPQSMSEMLSLPETVGFGHLCPHTINQSHFPLSTEHLPRLDTLTLPCTSWLNTRELKLNPSISHLEITRCPSLRDLLLELLGTQVDLLKNLVTISLGSYSGSSILHYGHVDGDENVPSHLPSPIKLPRLMSITFESVHPNWVDIFLKCTIMPHLERASLSLVHNVGDFDSMPTPQGIVVEYADNNTPAGLTSLHTLHISTHISWSSLKLLKVLSSPTIATLHVQIHDSHTREIPANDLLSQMAEVISLFKPCFLHLVETSYRNIQYILHSINPQHVQSLEVDFDEWYTDVPSYDLYPRPTLSSLVNIKLKDDNLNIIPQFLMNISANILRSVSLSIGQDLLFPSHDTTILVGNQVGGLTPLTRLLSVEEIEFTTHDPNLPNIWEFAPNVCSLNIRINSTQNRILDHSVTHPVECIASIISQIGPNDACTPLLRLQSFSLTYTIQCSKAVLKELLLSISPHGKLHDRIKKVLAIREEFGGVPLELKTTRLMQAMESQVHDILIKISCKT